VCHAEVQITPQATLSSGNFGFTTSAVKENVNVRVLALVNKCSHPGFGVLSHSVKHIRTSPQDTSLRDRVELLDLVCMMPSPTQTMTMCYF
jgi:hypothetical protein